MRWTKTFLGENDRASSSMEGWVTCPQPTHPTALIGTSVNDASGCHYKHHVSSICLAPWLFGNHPREPCCTVPTVRITTCLLLTECCPSTNRLRRALQATTQGARHGSLDCSHKMPYLTQNNAALLRTHGSPPGVHPRTYTAHRSPRSHIKLKYL